VEVWRWLLVLVAAVEEVGAELGGASDVFLGVEMYL